MAVPIAAQRRSHHIDRGPDRLGQVKILLLTIILLALAGTSSSLSILNLSPVYGSVPPTLYHRAALTSAAFIAFASKYALKGRLSPIRKDLIPLLAYYIPVVQSFLFPFSGSLGATYGPLVTECLSLLPLVVLTLHVVLELVDEFSLRHYSNLTSFILPAVSYYMLYATETLANTLIPTILGANPLCTRTGLQYVLSSIYAVLLPFKWLLLIIPSLTHLFFFNPHLPMSINTARLNTSLQTHGFCLLDRHESLTGYISVLENTVDGFRVMRCDHSLLGGEWLVTPERVRQGIAVREPVYAVFSMLEAVRLVVGEDEVGSRSKVVDEDKRALVIGLGTGTAPTALINHAINTTIIELDPIVHRYATKYFDLPPNHTAIIQDAVTWVENVVDGTSASGHYETDNERQHQTYDYIIHDVFTGGAEPLELFTVEFLGGLYELLGEGGAIAINYAADLSLPTTPLILTTILSIFSQANCRIYRDQPPLSPSSSSSSSSSSTTTTQAHSHSPPSDFVNAVIFCYKPTKSKPKSKSHSKSKSNVSDPTTQKTWSFRPATPQDHLNSSSRKRYIPPPAELEMDFDELLRGHSSVFDLDEEDAMPGGEGGTGGKEVEGKVLRKDDKKMMREMRKWQIRGALRHWEIMRGVLPAGVWEAW